MKFLNLDSKETIEISNKDIARIEKFKSYPDKFQLIEEAKTTKTSKEK